MQAKYKNYAEQVIGYVLMLFVITSFLVLMMNSCEVRSKTKSIQSGDYVISTKVQP